MQSCSSMFVSYIRVSFIFNKNFTIVSLFSADAIIKGVQCLQKLLHLESGSTPPFISFCTRLKFPLLDALNNNSFLCTLWKKTLKKKVQLL